MIERVVVTCCSIAIYTCLSASAVEMDGQKPAETANSSELGAIDGIILDLHGAPLRKAIVTLAPSQDERTQQNRSYSSVSDSEGHFSLESVEPGRTRTINR